MKIENNIVRHYLRNVFFITGTSCAGKSTMVRLLCERYGLIACGENYHAAVSDLIAAPDAQPNLCYFKTMSGWQEFVSRTPEAYERWIDGCSAEAAEFEIAQLLTLSSRGRIVADTNISLPLLREIASYRQVAVMLAPPDFSVDRFFDRPDPEKQFLLAQIRSAPDPQAAMENYRNILRRLNSPERYAAYAQSGFFTLMRDTSGADTREETLCALARHFGLMD